jgi:RimJ/RimL family protein N-acetyltransferase
LDVADEIATPRLLLRRATADDTAHMHRIFTDPEAMKYWSTLPHTDLAQTEKWMASMIEAPVELSDDYIVTLDNDVIGKLGCWRLPEIGFLLDPALWGRGYASEALSAFIDHRRAKGSEELTADVDPRNRSSIRLLEKAGFEESGCAARTWQLGDEWCDSLYLRLDLTRR